MKALSLLTKDGYHLSAHLFESPSPRALVQINPATATPQTFYFKLAEFISAAGFTVIVCDYRGIGKSKSKPLRHETYTFSDYHKDMDAMTSYLITHYSNLPILVIGHSVGGQLLGLQEHWRNIKAAVMISSSTGSRFSQPFSFKLQSLFFFSFFSPISIAFTGYVAAKRFGIMEDLPRNVVKQWGKWCATPTYWTDEVLKDFGDHAFNRLNIPILNYRISDDPIATEQNVEQLLSFYTSAKKEIKLINPQDIGVKSIGHFGFFSSRFKATLWQELMKDINGLV